MFGDTGEPPRRYQKNSKHFGGLVFDNIGISNPYTQSSPHAAQPKFITFPPKKNEK